MITKEQESQRCTRVERTPINASTADAFLPVTLLFAGNICPFLLGDAAAPSCHTANPRQDLSRERRGLNCTRDKYGLALPCDLIIGFLHARIDQKQINPLQAAPLIKCPQRSCLSNVHRTSRSRRKLSTTSSSTTAPLSAHRISQHGRPHLLPSSFIFLSDTILTSGSCGRFVPEVS